MERDILERVFLTKISIPIKKEGFKEALGVTLMHYYH